MPTKLTQPPIDISDTDRPPATATQFDVKKLASVILGLALIGVFFAVIGWSIWKVLMLSTPAAGPFVVAVLTAIGSVSVVLISKFWERRKEIEQEHRNKKIPIYTKFMDLWFRVLLAKKLGKQPVTEKELVQFFGEFTQDLIIWELMTY